jgi:hypothetical protein
MTLSKAKSICILLLAILTVYQTGVLWFVNITNRNFLLNFFPFAQQAAIPEGADRLVTPWRVITSHGGGRFSAQYGGFDSEHYANAVLSHLFQNGRFLGSQPLDELPYIFSDKAYIYEYAFPMEAEWFSLGFGQRSALLTSQVAAPFRRVVIQPPAAGSDEAGVFFVCEYNYVHSFAVSPPGAGGPESFAYDISGEGAPPYYVFTENQFIRYGEVVFHSVHVTNPYTDDGVFSLDFVMGQVAWFFSNPGAVRLIGGSDVFVYRDVSTVVRYYATNVLEYISYRVIDRSTPASFLSDYSAAVLFVERDNLVINDFYLAGFREDEGQNIFYFNYVIGNTPLLMAEGWSDQLSHPIIVTVDHGAVVRYRKLAYNFHIDALTLQRADAGLHGFRGSYTNVILGYKISGQNIDSLHWFFDGRAFPLN